MSEKIEKSEADLREWGMEYDKRLSCRVHQRQIDIVDACAAHEGKTRAVFMRDLINMLGEKAKSKGIIE